MASAADGDLLKIVQDRISIQRDLVKKMRKSKKAEAQEAGIPYQEEEQSEIILKKAVVEQLCLVRDEIMALMLGDSYGEQLSVEGVPKMFIPKPVYLHASHKEPGRGQLIPSSKCTSGLIQRVSFLSDMNQKVVEEQRWLETKLGKFALSVDYFDYEKINVEKSKIVARGIILNLSQWFSSIKKLSDKTELDWNYCMEQFLYPLLRMLSLWLMLALSEGYVHGDLLSSIYFEDERQPRLLMSGGFDHSTPLDKDKKGVKPHFYQGDLNAMKHILYVFANQLSVEALLDVKKVDYSQPFHADVPLYIVSFYEVLDTFDEKIFISRVALDPPFLWSRERKLHTFLTLYKYVYEDETVLREFAGYPFWPWRECLEGLPSDHVLRKYYDIATRKPQGAPAEAALSKITDPKKCRHWSTKYSNDCDLTRFCRNAFNHLKQELPDEKLTNISLLQMFDDIFNLMSKVAQGINLHGINLRMNSVTLCDNFLRQMGYKKIQDLLNEF